MSNEANTPKKTNTIEFYVKKNSDGVVTQISKSYILTPVIKRKV